MFGPYQITHQGRTYHGNISLAEHRLIERDGRWCLFRGQDLGVMTIAPEVAHALVRHLPSPGTLVPDALMRAYQACGLVATPDPAAPRSDTTPASATPAAEPLRRPVVNIALFLAQRCNLRCRYCYGAGGDYGNPGLMSRATAFAAVDWLMAQSLDAEQVHVGFFGGEPLLNLPVLRQVVAYAKQQASAKGKRVNFNITTNATLLTDDVIAFFQAEQIKPLISLDGPPEIHNRQRPFRNGRGSYGRVVAKLDRLRTAVPDLMARAVLCDGVDPFAVSRGLEAAGFTIYSLGRASPAILQEAGAAAGQRRDATEDARAAAADQMLAYRRAEVDRLFAAVRTRTLEVGTAPEALARLAGLARGRKRHVGCGVGRGMAAVSVSGDLYPCHRFVGLDGVRLGHLSDERPAGLNAYHRAVVDNLPVCRGCWVRYLCGGGCFYDHLARTGDLHRPDPLVCREIQAVFEDLIFGWGQLDTDSRAYLRERIEAWDPEAAD